jgi:hypothetical protein
MAPSGNLIATFEALIADFNDAKNVKSYQNFRQYLYPIALIQKVDDPGEFVIGPPTTIINYLNGGEAQTGFFPQFQYDADPQPNQYTNKFNEPIGDVTGTGTYQDKITNSAIIPVRYLLRFKQIAGNWLLATALVVPR